MRDDSDETDETTTMWDILKVYVPITLLVIAGFVVAWQFVDPAPPKTITIAAGAPDGAYSAFAERYKTVLADEGSRSRCAIPRARPRTSSSCSTPGAAST